MTTNKKLAVVLSGCGVFDGAEIHESVFTLHAIERQGSSYQCFAPNIEQHHVIDHLTGNAMDQTRHVLIESARIARGAIKDLAAYKAADFDALVFPGGFGAAKNLSTFALDGPTCEVNGEVARAIKETRELGKPIGALCIAPAVIAKVLGDVNVTIGDDAETAGSIEKLGATHTSTTHGELVVDETAKIVTTPCYMLDASISQVAIGAENAIQKVLELA